MSVIPIPLLIKVRKKRLIVVLPYVVSIKPTPPPLDAYEIGFASIIEVST